MDQDDDLTPGERIWKETYLRNEERSLKSVLGDLEKVLHDRARSKEDRDKAIVLIEKTKGYLETLAFTTAGGLTKTAVYGVRFAKARGAGAYTDDEVGLFLNQRVYAALKDPPEDSLTPEEVRDVTFSAPSAWSRGYDYVEVDAFLDLIEEQLRARQAGTTPARAGFSSPEKRHSALPGAGPDQVPIDGGPTLGERIWRLADLTARAVRSENGGGAIESAPPFTSRMTAEQVAYVDFDEAPISPGGYDKHEVDAFLGRVKAALQDPAGRALTPEEVHDVTFSMRHIPKRGYDPRDVDAFLDLVEEQLKALQGGFTPARAGFNQVELRHAKSSRP
jgi:DivIVA domain-containing protein